MRIAATTAAVLIAAFATEAIAQDRPAAYTNAEACLSANADAAVAASAGAADAADFLLNYLCAGPVAVATRYEINSDLLASGKALMEGYLTMMPAQTEMVDGLTSEMSSEEIDAWIAEQEAAAEAAEADSLGKPPTDLLEGVSVDPVTGDITTADSPIGPVITTLLEYMEATGRIMSATPPVFLRERAAALIVERRRR